MRHSDTIDQVTDNLPRLLHNRHNSDTLDATTEALPKLFNEKKTHKHRDTIDTVTHNLPRLLGEKKKKHKKKKILLILSYPKCHNMYQKIHVINKILLN